MAAAGVVAAAADEDRVAGFVGVTGGAVAVAADSVVAAAANGVADNQTDHRTKRETEIHSPHLPE